MRFISLLFLIFFVSFTLISLTTEANGSYGYIGGKMAIGVIVFANTLSAFLWSWLLAQYDASVTIRGVHFTRAIYRLALLSLFPIALNYISDKPQYMIVIFHNLVIFGLFFDIFYNHYKGNHWGYVGTQSFVDKTIRSINEIDFMHKAYPLWYLFLKIGLVLLSLNLIHNQLHI